MNQHLARIFLTFYFTFFLLCSFGCALESNRIKDMVDIDRDGKSELIFCSFKPEGLFYETVTLQNTNHNTLHLGELGSIPVYGDFSGDGSTDYGIYKNERNNNNWYLINELNMSGFRESFGMVGDLPIPGDYDGDNKSDYVVYRPSNSGFYGRLSDKNKELEIHFGVTGDIPVPKDYDGDRKTDIATYRIQSGSWLIKSSKNDLSKQVVLGGPDYFPIPADYDGDGKTDLAAWNYRNNDCKITFSTSNSNLPKNIKLQIQTKLQGCECFPISSDYNGDGKCELAFWDSKNQIAHIFEVGNGRFKHEKFQITVNQGAKPINYFLLNKFIKRPEKIDHLFLYERYISNIADSQNVFVCDIDGDFIDDLGNYDAMNSKFIFKQSSNNEEKYVSFSIPGDTFLSSDFDGDGRCDFGSFNSARRTFTYISSVSEQPVCINFDKDINGIPFSVDLDLDFKSDLAFYNSKSMILSFVLSSDFYRYDEVLLHPNKV